MSDEPKPTPGLVEAVRTAEKILRCTVEDLRGYRGYLGAKCFGPEILDCVSAADALVAALTECGEWEEINCHTFQIEDDDLDTICPICEALKVIENAWPGAELWRRRNDER